MHKSITSLLATIIAVALFSTSLTSCKSDEKIDPQAPIIKFIPTTISIDQTMKYTESGKTLNRTNKYTFTYNDKNQLIELKNVGKTNQVATHSFTYNEGGTLVGLRHEREEYPIDAIFVYDLAAATVTPYWDEMEDATYHINVDGLPQSNKHIDSKKYQTYKYDKFNNLEQIYDCEKNGAEYEVETSIASYEETRNYKYSTLFSPYRFLSLPPWFYTTLPRLGVQLEMPFEEGATGIHLLSSMESNIAIADNDKRVENVANENITISILKEQDNYPTEIKYVMKEKEDGEEVSTTTRTYTIIYKEIQ